MGTPASRRSQGWALLSPGKSITVICLDFTLSSSFSFSVHENGNRWEYAQLPSTKYGRDGTVCNATWSRGWCFSALGTFFQYLCFKNFVRKSSLIVFEKHVLFLFYSAIQNHLTAPFTALCESQLERLFIAMLQC